MKGLAVAFGLLAVGLAGCAQSPPAITAKASNQDAAVTPKAVVTVIPKKPAPPPVAALKPRILLDPSVVVGKSAIEIKKAFGDPNLRREDSPAEVWQYLATGCALHLFFYPGESGDALVVRHIAINGRSVKNFSDLDRKQCFNDHLKAVGAEDAFVDKATS